ncbi:MAG TPA: M48 family metalloprotease, partial [Rhodanobacteraceae bacterium]|nr:M48 family metalloprotease [Rhodanobacteraceae bacterium]
EAEADRVGIQTLAKSGYDPLAMADAFATLQRVMRVNGVDVPEFLLDHPVDTARIADAKARAQNLSCSSVPQPAQAHPASAASATLNLNLPATRVTDIKAEDTDEAAATAASDAATMAVEKRGKDGALPRVSVTACGGGNAASESYFELMRERARVLTSDAPSKVRAYYANNLRNDAKFDTTANRYGYALALTRSGESGEAAAELRKLVARRPESSVLRLALADALDQSGAKSESLQLYDRLNTDFPGNRAVTLAYADSLLARADVKSAQRAQELLRPMVERYSDDPDLQKSFGHACQLAGDKVRASEAYAEAAYLNGHAEDALNQLKALSKQSDLTYYQRSRVDARITQLTPEVLALRKRGSGDKDKAPDSLVPAFRVGPGPMR